MGSCNVSCIVVLAICFCAVSCQRTEDPIVTSDPLKSELHARQAWIKMDKDLKTAVSKIVRKALPTLMKEVYKKELSTPCLSVLLQFSTALRQSKLWAYQMLDSCGRFPEGFLSGTLTSLGNYEECLSIHVNETKLKLKGQYCRVNLLPPLPPWKPFTSLHLTVPELFNISAPDTVITYLGHFLHNLHVTTVKVGLCTPSICTVDDINKLVQIVPEKLGINWDFVVHDCETRESVHFTFAQLIAMFVLGVLVLILLTGTIVGWVWASEEMENKSLKAGLFHALKAFSVTANAKKLSDYTSPQENLSFVHGIVFIVFYWVAVSNTFMYINYDQASNFVEALRLVKNLFYEVLLNRIVPLQAMFFISGLLTTYRWLKCPDNGLKIWKFLLKRYWRYTPAYALLLVLILLTPTWGSGPSWASQLTPMYNNCQDNWWYNLLYINNYGDKKTTCLDHTWFLAVDAQLHVIAIIILIPLKLRPKIGLMINFVLALASLASVALTNVYYDLPPNEMLAFLDERDRMYYSSYSYSRVYTHVSLYCTGVFVGYLMSEYPNLKISRRTSLSMWLLTTTGIAAALCTVHEWRNGPMPSPLLGALYSTFSKVAQSAFLAWLSVACMTGNAGGFEDILGWRPFAFLSRLFFAGYIMYVPIIKMVMGFKKGHVFISEMEIFYIVLNHVAGSYVVAYILYLCFEAPWISLADVVRKRCNGKTFTNDDRTITEKPTRSPEKVHLESSKVWATTLDKNQC